jgi:hypothetical protein
LHNSTRGGPHEISICDTKRQHIVPSLWDLRNSILGDGSYNDGCGLGDGCTPYTVSVFATSVPKVYYQPDSITVWNNRAFIGYGNNAKPDGTFGFSTIVEYAMDGTVLHKVRVKGHNDGLKVDPKTNLLWALQNEDARPNLVILDPSTWKSKK